MSQPGDVRALARRDNNAVDAADDTVRMAQEVARVTLEEARAEAERLRAAAQEQAAKLSAEARAEAERLESDVRSMEDEIARLAKQLAVLEGQEQSPVAALPVIPRIRWEDDADAMPDTSTVERDLRDVETERRRLQGEIAAAKHRIAKAASGPARAAAERELGSLVLAAYDEWAAIEEEHRAAVDTIRGNARAEADRILEAAHEQATAAHARAAELAGLAGQERT